jgi:hypothetical protein
MDTYLIIWIRIRGLYKKPDRSIRQPDQTGCNFIFLFGLDYPG